MPVLRHDTSRAIQVLLAAMGLSAGVTIWVLGWLEATAGPVLSPSIAVFAAGFPRPLFALLFTVMFGIAVATLLVLEQRPAIAFRLLLLQGFESVPFV